MACGVGKPGHKTKLAVVNFGGKVLMLSNSLSALRGMKGWNGSSEESSTFRRWFASHVSVDD